MKKIYGDLIDRALKGEFDVIVHGCNCFCTMGKGIAKSIKHHFPLAFEADLSTPKGDRGKLGTYSSVTVTISAGELTVVNAYTQFNYRGKGPNVDYEAIRQVFAKIKEDFTGKRIAYPLIGAGLAGGDWKIIESIIKDELAGEDHTVVVFANPSEDDLLLEV